MEIVIVVTPGPLAVCPACDHENHDLTERCVVCGRDLTSKQT
jgi:hypothetical protein